MITEEDYLKAKKIVQEYETKHLNISDVMNSNFSLTLTKQELIKLITESYAAGFDKGGETSHNLLKKGKYDGDNVKMRNDFIKSKLLELKFGEK